MDAADKYSSNIYHQPLDHGDSPAGRNQSADLSFGNPKDSVDPRVTKITPTAGLRFGVTFSHNTPVHGGGLALSPLAFLRSSFPNSIRNLEKRNSQPTGSHDDL